MRLTADLFSTRAYQTIAKAALGHIAAFATPPRVHISDLLEKELKRGEDSQILRTVIEAMEGLHGELQPDFVIKELDKFINTRKFAQALERASDALEEGDLGKAQDALYMSGAVQPPSPGIWLHDAERMLGFLDVDEADVFGSGVAALDARNVRPRRKAMFLFLASAKAGKSWYLIAAAIDALMSGKKVLHITLENSEELTAQRYVQSLFALAADEADEMRVPMFVKDDEGRHTRIDFHTITPRQVRDVPRNDLEKRLEHFKKRGRLLIKEFPTGMLTVPQLNAYLDTLAKTDGFVPDMLVIDYADLMTLDVATLRLDTGRLYRELRGVGVQRNMAVVTASQGNRGSATARVVGVTNVAEDWSKIGTVDTVVTYSQTAAEHKLNLARLYVAAARGSKDKFIVLISQAYATGQFCLDSVFFNHYMASEVDRLSGDEEGTESH